MPKVPTATLLDPNYVYGMARISEALREESIEHAFVGGTAVQALCCYLDTNKGAQSIKDEPARTHVTKLRQTDDYDIIAVADERAIRRVLANIQGDEVLNGELYETRVTSKGWKNPSIQVESTLQTPINLRINFSVASKDSKLLSPSLYLKEITTAEDVEFRGRTLQVPVRIVNPDYILASKIARNHKTSEGEQKDFYDARLILEAVDRYNTDFACLEGDEIELDWNRILSYVPLRKIDNMSHFARYLQKNECPDETIDALVSAIPEF